MALAETIAPTTERLRKVRTGLDIPALDQKQARTAWRVVPLIDMLFRTERINRDFELAFRRFERDWQRAQHYPSCIAKYGSQAAASTPAHQMTDGAMTTMETQEERRDQARRRATAALRAVGGHSHEALVLAMGEDTDLEAIGRALSGYGSAKQCQAVALMLLRDAMLRLHQHYDEG